jgi:Tol biopolymer transport system component/type II secretory pathway predicted ATPase ExeA
MELPFFNLKYNPFVHPPSPHRLFRSRSYLRGMQRIAYSLEGFKGLTVIFAPRGMGKTTLLHAYLDQRQQHNIRTIWLTGPSSSFVTILHRLCTTCQVPFSGDFKMTLRELRAALRRERAAGRRMVLVIDDAESLPAKTLSDLAVLADMEDESGKLLRVILIGEPVLDQHLKRLYSQMLRVDTYRRIRIEPLQRRERIAYIQHLIAQGSTDAEAMFTPRALRCVVRYARGNPGLLNYVCNEALRAAIIKQQKPITKPIVQDVLNDLEGRQPFSLWRWGIAALVGMLVLAGVSMGSPQIEELWQQSNLASLATGLVSKVKALPSAIIGRDTPRNSETPATTTVHTRHVPTPNHEPQTPSRPPETSETAPKTSETLAAQAVSEQRQHRLASQTDLIAKASLLCLTARPPGNHARDIILVDYHGKVQQRLVSNGMLNLSPILSPDRRHLAYTSYREGTPSLYVRDLKNAKDERLTSRSGMALPGAWSPDGRYLALSKSEDGNSDIFLYDLKRRHMRRLTSHHGIDISPSFAPDSKRLVFTSSRSGSSQIYLTDINGRTPTRLTVQSNYNTAPVWSPQGNWIAFVSRSPENTLALYVIQEDGTGLRQVTMGGSTIEEAPTWSPDGRSILYTRVYHGMRQRRIVALEGNDDRELPGHGQVCYAPQWVAQLTH